MSNICVLNEELAKERENLKIYEEARLNIISTGQSYSIQNGDDRRQLEHVSLSTINALIDQTKAKIAQLERQIKNNGYSGKVAVVGVRL